MISFARERVSKKRKKLTDDHERWDSSDPERAPPPLPLNPGTGTPGASPTKPNTSATVAAAAQALVDRARENLTSSYVTNPHPGRSPEKSPTKTPQHRRLESLQHGGSREFKPILDTSSEAGSTRPSTPQMARDFFTGSPERNPGRSGTPTPTRSSQDLKDAGALRTSARPPRTPLLRENTPPSATMLAIQNMVVPDMDGPLGDVTNASTPTPRKSQSFDSIHSQMLNLTTIATTLQKEMAALSKRSKDNATDLLSLKEATKTRDEDIRKSLRELVTSSRHSDQRLLEPPQFDQTRPNSALGITRQMLDDRPYNSPSSATKSYSMPRFPPVGGFDTQTEHDRATSPMPFMVDSTPSVAMLEKIVREMVTKDGQDKLLVSLTDLINESGKESARVLQKVIEVMESLRDDSSKAMVRHSDGRKDAFDEAYFLDRTDHTAVARSDPTPTSLTAPPQPQPAVVSDELLKLLQKIKDSVMQGGGMTGEIKSLMKELRGEVLGMGRELGRKLENHKSSSTDDRSITDTVTREELANIVQDGLSDLRDQMEGLIQTRRRESSSSALSRNTVDNAEVYAVVKHAIAEQMPDQSQALQQQQPPLDHESILVAVKEAYEAYKPEIELQQFGLERDEILQCLKEGLEDYQPSGNQPTDTGISRDEVLDAVQEAMQNFNPPAPATEATEIKEEVLLAVRDCLEDFKQSQHDSSTSRALDLTRDDVRDAVKEGIGNFRKEDAREIEISPEDLFQAVRSGLESMDNPFGAYGSQVITSLQEIVEGMRVEFKQYSEANGRDTEQVLDAMKDGLESLRAEVESYVDRAQDVTGKEEIIEVLRGEIGGLRSGFDEFVAGQGAKDSVTDRSELANYIKSEFENLQEVIASQGKSEDGPAQQHEAILQALDDGFAQVKSAPTSRGLDDPSEEQLEALKAEFEQLRETILSGTAAHKDEIMDQLHESLGGLHERIGGTSRGIEPNGEVTEALREEIAALKDSLQAPVLHAGASNNEAKEELVEAIMQSMNGIRAQLSAEQSETNKETLGIIKEELDSFREAIGGSLMLSAPGIDRKVVSEAVRAGIEEMQENLGPNASNAEALESIREELEHLRQSIATAVVQTGAHTGTEDILETLRSGLDDLKAQMSGQVAVSAQGSNIDQEGLENVMENLSSLRADIARVHDKPVDMTVSYDILDTLKEGLSDIRADLDRLKSGSSAIRDNEVVLAETGLQNERAVPNQAEAPGSMKRSDLERIEVMLAQLQIKVEAMDLNIQSQPHAATSDASSKIDMGKIESSLLEIQSTITAFSAREPAARSTGVSKEDTDALETLLQNTKAKIDEHIIPGLEATVTRDHLDGIEAVVRMTNEAVESLSGRLGDNTSGKEDIAAIALLVHEATVSLNEVKDKLSSVQSEGKESKGDIDVVEELCGSIKAKLEEMPGSIPSKADIEELGELLADFRESHNQLKESYEGDIGITAKAFDDRKNEASTIMEQIEDLKGFVEETRDHLKSRMKRGNEDVRALDEILQTMEEKIDAIPDATSDVDELKETVRDEFERAHATLEEVKSGHASTSSAIMDKYEEHRSAIISEMVQKLDDRFNEVMSSHEEQKKVIGHAATSMTEKAAQQDELLAGSQAMAEDLKVTIDTLGASVTAISPALAEATEKMGDDSKTVFNKVDEMYTKLDDANVDSKTNHQLTRDEVAKALTAVDGLHEEVSSSHPKVMDALKTLLAAVEQHYEHTKASQVDIEKSSDGLKAHFDEGLKRLPVPQIEAPTSAVSADRYDDTRIHRKLDDILSKSVPVQQDDTETHAKLDELLAHLTSLDKKGLDTEKLDEVHQQLATIPSEISAFVAFQTKLLSADHGNKEKEANQAALDLTKCLNEKDVIESDIASFRQTKDTLAAEVEALKAEREQLNTQKMHLSADVSSLETAMRIRREELHMMDTRADALERRIIEGVMDHSRALLIAKTPRAPANMNLKRVGSNQSTATTATTTPSVVNNGIGMALKARTNDRKKQASINPSARRIASLGQITGNAPTGGKNIASLKSPGGLGNLKRSQSTRTPKGRKHSWNAAEHGSLAGFDKENDVLSEESEPEDEADNGKALTRAASYAGPRTSDVTAATRRTSGTTAPSEYTYGSGTGSYMTGSDLSRRSSYGSTIRSGPRPGSSLENLIHEEAEEEEEEDDDKNSSDEKPEDDVSSVVEHPTPYEEPQQLEAPPVEEKPGHGNLHGLVLHNPDGYDSGLGSDLPTAALSTNMGSDYFRPPKQAELS